MLTPIVIVAIGLFIFWGHYLSGVFERRGIPDVLGLMLIGMLLGPVFGVVDPRSFGPFGSIFSNLVLIFILFESGTDLRLKEVRSSFRGSAGITTLGFFTTWFIMAILGVTVFDLSWLSALFVGATLGGTSSAVVVGLVRRIGVTPKTSTMLIMESVETDAFTLAIPLGILGLMITGEFQAHTVISHFISSIIISVLMGIGGAFLWSFILGRFPTLKSTKFMTPAFLFILFGITEALNFSGPLTALTFGIAIGNLSYIEPRFLERIIPNQDIILQPAERSFFSEMVFLLRTFFFVFIGISVKIDRIDWLLLGAVVTLVLFISRILLVPIVLSERTPLLDKAVVSVMIPKGLGAAVIATLPFQRGVPEGAMIQAICFSVILFSTIYCAALFFLIHKGYSMPFYRLIYGRDKSHDKPMDEPDEHFSV